MPLKIETYLKRQIAIIDGLPTQFYGRVKRQQYTMLSEALDLVRDLETEAGKILVNQTNLTRVNQITQRLQQTFFNEDYVEAVRDLTEGFDKAATLNKQWLSGALGTELGVDITGSADLLLQRQKRNATELLIGQSAINQEFFAPIENNLIGAVSTQSTIAELTKNLRETIVGSDQVDGRLLRYAKQIAADAVTTGDRNYMDNLAKGAGAEFYQYVGGLITDSREFCVQRNGQFFHREEVELWGTTPANWQGRFRGTNEATIFTWCGGYNCKHSLLPVSEINVPKDVLRRAMEKGYYKPSEAVKEKLGLNEPAPKKKKKDKTFKGTGNRKRAETWLKDNAFKNVNLPSVSDSDMDQIAEAVSDLKDKYKIDKMTVLGRMHGEALAGANADELVWNTDRFNAFQKAIEAGVVQKPKGVYYTRELTGMFKDRAKNIRFTVNHEFGHVIADQRFGDVEGAALLKRAGLAFPTKTTQKQLIEMFAKDLSLIDKAPAGLLDASQKKVLKKYVQFGKQNKKLWSNMRNKVWNLSTPENDYKWTRSMSQYAFSKPEEFLAESFAMYNDPIERELLHPDVIELIEKTLIN